MPLQPFQTVTTDLHRLVDWLVTCRVTTVALAAHGRVVPIYEMLEARELAVHLVNARAGTIAFDTGRSVGTKL